jgi:hypothetical protein
MIPITLEISDDLARRLRPLEDRISHILELGIRELNASEQNGFSGASEVLEFLANLPTPEEILALRPSPALEERVRYLLEAARTSGLSPQQEQEWEHYQYLEHLVRMAKARAAVKLHRT